jgi:murein DD-endopeptidase MepM/ murein hydrolase activator NlpD
MNIYNPLDDMRVTSGFGNRIHPVTGAYKLHNGIDLGVPNGTPILAPQKGVVKSIYSNSTGGNQLIIEHPNNYTTGYAHLQGYNVKEGDTVKNGQTIAFVGSTGPVTGPHLHFTLKQNGDYLNPEDVLKERTFFASNKKTLILIIVLLILAAIIKFIKKGSYGIRIR